MNKPLLSRGVLYSLGIVFNRLVPERLFRFRVCRVLRLQPLGTDNTTSEMMPIAIRWCESEDDFRQAERLTQFQPVGGNAREDLAACLAHASMYDSSDRAHTDSGQCRAPEAASEIDSSGSPLAGLWRAENRFDEVELGVRMLLADDQAWIAAAIVAKSYRGRGVYRRLLNHVLTDSPNQRHFAAINPANRASMAAHRKFVAATVGTYVSFRLLSLAVVMASGGLRPSTRVSLSCRQRPIEISIFSVP